MGKNRQTFTPDLVYGRPDCLEVVDFKTFWHPLTEPQVQGDFQARFYMYNAMRIWPHFPNYRFTQSYVRFGKSTSVDFKPEDFGSFTDEVEAVAASIEEAGKRNEWPATAGVECSYCELRCPLADNHAVLPPRLTVPEQAQLVGAWYLTDDVKRRAAQKALKAYVSAHGAFKVGDVEFDIRPVLQRSYPIGSVLHILHERNIAGAMNEEGLMISHSALGKLLKRFPMLEEDLLPFQQSRTSYRFGAAKPGIGDDGEES